MTTTDCGGALDAIADDFRDWMARHGLTESGYHPCVRRLALGTAEASNQGAASTAALAVGRSVRATSRGSGRPCEHGDLRPGRGAHPAPPGRQRRARDRTETETVEAIDRKLTMLAEDRRARVTTALEAGVDAATLRAALAKLDDRVRALEAHRVRLAAAAEDRDAAVTRAERLRDLAATARATLSAMGPEDRRAVLDLLDVQVTVTGWEPCATCDGKGKVQGGRGGVVCPSCHAQRKVPSFLVQGFVVDALEVGQLGAAESRRSRCSRR